MRVFLCVCVVLGMCELPGSITVALLKFPWNFKSSDVCFLLFFVTAKLRFATPPTALRKPT